MSNFKIKICGVSNYKTIDCCISNSIEYFGLVFYKKSPRYISINKAQKLVEYVRIKKIIPVGVFFNHPLHELINIIQKTHLDHIQLHGNENQNYIDKIKNKFDIKIIKSIGIKERKDFINMYKLSNIDYFLFDYKPNTNELPGGNAKSFNWSLLQNIKIEKPWFISGGINVNNIGEINDKINPYGIDISSGVEEKKGIKNIKKINILMEKLNA